MTSVFKQNRSDTREIRKVSVQKGFKKFKFLFDFVSTCTQRILPTNRTFP